LVFLLEGYFIDITLCGIHDIAECTHQSRSPFKPCGTEQWQHAVGELNKIEMRDWEDKRTVASSLLGRSNPAAWSRVANYERTRQENERV
jgi:hypothetical protein